MAAFAVFRHTSSYVVGLKIAHPDQVVSGRRKGEHPTHSVCAPKSSLVVKGHGLHPSEDFLNAFAFPLTDKIAVVTRRSSIHRARAVAIVLRHVGRHARFA